VVFFPTDNLKDPNISTLNVLDGGSKIILLPPPLLIKYQWYYTPLASFCNYAAV